jgi:hypothetical protein
MIVFILIYKNKNQENNMKKPFIAVITGLLFCSVAMAADPNTPVSNPSAVQTPAIATSEGTVASLNQAESTFKLSTPSGNVDVSYKNAEVLQAGKKTDISALKEGVKVKVLHISEGKMHIARSIEIVSAK